MSAGMSADELLEQTVAAARGADTAAALAQRQVDMARDAVREASARALVAAEHAGRAQGVLAAAVREHGASECDPEHDRAALERMAVDARMIAEAATGAYDDVRRSLASILVAPPEVDHLGPAVTRVWVPWSEAA